MSDDEKSLPETPPVEDNPKMRKSGKLNYGSGSDSDKIFLAERALDGLTNDTEERKVLATVGYDDEKINGFKGCYDTTLEAHLNFQKESSDKVGSYAEFEKLFLKSKTNMQLFSKVAKVALKNDPLSLAKLNLYTKKGLSNADVITNMNSFYMHIFQDSSLVELFAKFGFDKGRINDFFEGVKNTQSAYNVYATECKESVLATKHKDKKIAELDEWMEDYYTLYKVAFALRDEEMNN